MERIRAERLLEKLDTAQAEVGPESAYDIVLKATGNRQLADSYRIAIIKSRQRPVDSEPLE